MSQQPAQPPRAASRGDRGLGTPSRYRLRSACSSTAASAWLLDRWLGDAVLRARVGLLLGWRLALYMIYARRLRPRAALDPQQRSERWTGERRVILRWPAGCPGRASSSPPSRRATSTCPRSSTTAMLAVTKPMLELLLPRRSSARSSTLAAGSGSTGARQAPVRRRERLHLRPQRRSRDDVIGRKDFMPFVPWLSRSSSSSCSTTGSGSIPFIQFPTTSTAGVPAS